MKPSIFFSISRASPRSRLILADALASRLAFSARMLSPALDDAEKEDTSGAKYVAPWEAAEQITILPEGIAVIPIKGALARGYDQISAWFFFICRFEFLERAIATVAARDGVRVVVFDIDSPGGTCNGTPETAAMLAELTAAKPTIAFTAGYCASAAYWLASQCSRIVATPSSYVGSIGTKIVIYDVSEMLAKAGVKLELIAAGKFKGAATPGKPLTDEERALFQAEVDRINDDFVSAVTSARGQIAEADMQGQVFAGSVSVGKGLVDATTLSFNALLNEVRGSLPQQVSPGTI